jgi:hypothetical protein
MTRKINCLTAEIQIEYKRFIDSNKQVLVPEKKVVSKRKKERSLHHKNKYKNQFEELSITKKYHF